MIARLYAALIATINALMVVFFVLLVGAVFLQVVARYIFSAPPFWTEELARYLLIWITFVGAALVHHHNEHIAVDMIRGALPLLLRKIVNLLISLMIMGFLVLLTQAGLTITQFGTQTSPALGISMQYVYGALLVGALAMIVVTLGQIWRDLLALAGRAPVRDDIATNADGATGRIEGDI